MLSHENGNRALRLAVLDLDGTLTTVRSPFMYVSKALGYGTEAEDIAARYWRGEIGYQAWGKQTVALWKDTREDTLRDIVASVPYRNGAEAFVRQLRRAGVTVALLSVAFKQHVLPRAAELQVEHVECNELRAEAGRLTGEISYVVNESNKSDMVRSLQYQYGLTTDHTLVAGDTEGDIPMFSMAALSIAVAPESSNVSKAARVRLPGDDWDNAIEMIDAEWPDWLPSTAT